MVWSLHFSSFLLIRKPAALCRCRVQSLNPREAERLAAETRLVSDLLHGGSEARGLLVSLQSGVSGCWVRRGCVSSPGSPLCLAPVHSTRLLLRCSARDVSSRLQLSLKAVLVGSAACWAPLPPRCSPYLFCPSAQAPSPCCAKLCASSISGVTAACCQKTLSSLLPSPETAL